MKEELLHGYTILVEEKTDHNVLISSRVGGTEKLDEAVNIQYVYVCM